ncbi:MAG TPA: putative toxin-antitoxin system toxin component, PIN family [Chloroflexota bacterium]|nr:putative toxin-antitoxin system toxin component, PIN family [Chloroflexota bacterium]HUM71064.1 putative toxin-antitoxin system toxin component, PIN family [Chloroflexota bacterium]
MRAVVDTNVIVRALIMPQGTVGPVLLRLRQGDYTLLYSDSLLEELADVLNRPRIRDKYRLTNNDIQTVLSLILLRGQAVTPDQTITICRDPKDNKFLEVAVAGRADVIVTGDDDLLVLHLFAGIPIVSPSTFLQML